MSDVLGQFLPDVAATFVGVFIALWLDHRRQRRNSARQEAALLNSLLSTLNDNITELEHLLQRLDATQNLIYPSMRIGLLGALIPRLAEVTDDVALVTSLEALRHELFELDRKLDRSFLLDSQNRGIPRKVLVGYARKTATDLLTQVRDIVQPKLRARSSELAISYKLRGAA